jgi:hypothetical protein
MQNLVPVEAELRAFIQKAGDARTVAMVGRARRSFS